VIKREEAD